MSAVSPQKETHGRRDHCGGKPWIEMKRSGRGIARLLAQ